MKLNTTHMMSVLLHVDITDSLFYYSNLTRTVDFNIMDEVPTLWICIRLQISISFLPGIT